MLAKEKFKQMTAVELAKLTEVLLDELTERTTHDSGFPCVPHQTLCQASTVCFLIGEGIELADTPNGIEKEG